MRPGRWSRAELKIECLRRVEHSSVTGWHKQVLANWIETYVRLSGEDAAEFLWLLELDENRGIPDMELTWLGQAEAQGLERGRAEGIEQSVKLLRQAVLRGIEQRFGPVPDRIRKKVQAVDAIEPLAEMVERLPLLDSVDDLLPLRRGRN